MEFSSATKNGFSKPCQAYQKGLAPNRYDPPQIGEHTRDVLTEVGLAPHQIEELANAGTIAPI
jgi:crotonobetainyl-CoA:carnitine CoA-transferase CaiB-like acyl-CoA transferase